MKRIFCGLFLWLTLGAFAHSAPLTFSSNQSHVSILELYTSEGCSSCPPAENWLNKLKDDPRLWTSFIPIAFHVDYWNYIGWSDRFSSDKYSKRQQAHSQQGHVSAVYTPGFILDGKERRGWRLNRPLAFNNTITSNLTATVNSQQLEIDYKVVEPITARVFVNVAVLGFDLKTQVRTGENAGRKLTHDFVVLGYERIVMNKTTGGYTLKTSLPQLIEQANKKALAVWVEYGEETTPVQATGGWLLE